MSQDGAGVEVTIERNGKTETRSGRYLIGADGASSAVRRSLGIEFEGFTWPDRLLVVSTPFDFFSVIPGLSSVSYVADPERWYFLLQIPGLWRAMFLVNEDASDERVQTPEFAQSLMAGVMPGISNYEIAHITLYKVHQRVAKTFKLGRAFLIGDAAHINNPLGGMGMNGGIHDAVNLAARLAAVWRGEAPTTPSSTASTSSGGWSRSNTSRSTRSRTRRTWNRPATNSATACAPSPPTRRAPATT